MLFSSDLNVANNLLDLNNHKLSRFKRRESNDDVHNAQVDVVLSRGFFVAFHKVGFFWRLTLECALAKQVMHERTDVQPDLRPQWLVVRFKYHPLCATEQTLLDIQSHSPHRYVFVFVR